MTPTDTQYFQGFEESLKTWTDERFVSREELRALAMFSKYIVNLAEAGGWRYDGHSYKESDFLGCLVVKATRDDIPQVVFTSARSYTTCVQVFVRKLEEGLLEWRKDRYRG